MMRWESIELNRVDRMDRMDRTIAVNTSGRYH